MLLNDPRLAFAQELIGHWTRVRGDDLVPLKDQIDPGEMRRALPFIMIMDVARPEAPAVRLAGTGLRPRYGQEITGTDWSRFIMPENRPRMRAVIGLLTSKPCGIFYRFKVSGVGNVMREAETVALPLREQEAGAPSLIIGITRDIAMRGDADASSLEPAKLEALAAEFIDIGAAIPDILPVNAARPT